MSFIFIQCAKKNRNFKGEYVEPLDTKPRLPYSVVQDVPVFGLVGSPEELPKTRRVEPTPIPYISSMLETSPLSFLKRFGKKRRGEGDEGSSGKSNSSKITETSSEEDKTTEDTRRNDLAKKREEKERILLDMVDEERAPESETKIPKKKKKKEKAEKARKKTAEKRNRSISAEETKEASAPNEAETKEKDPTKRAWTERSSRERRTEPPVTVLDVGVFDGSDWAKEIVSLGYLGIGYEPVRKNRNKFVREFPFLPRVEISEVEPGATMPNRLPNQIQEEQISSTSKTKQSTVEGEKEEDSDPCSNLNIRNATTGDGDFIRSLQCASHSAGKMEDLAEDGRGKGKGLPLKKTDNQIQYSIPNNSQHQQRQLLSGAAAATPTPTPTILSDLSFNNSRLFDFYYHDDNYYRSDLTSSTTRADNSSSIIVRQQNQKSSTSNLVNSTTIIGGGRSNKNENINESEYDAENKLGFFHLIGAALGETNKSVEILTRYDYSSLVMQAYLSGPPDMESEIVSVLTLDEMFEQQYFPPGTKFIKLVVSVVGAGIY